jgi:hypothetical protein
MSQHNGMDSITTVSANQAGTINKYKNLKHNTANPHITQLIRSEKSSRNMKTRKVNN